MDVHDLVSDFSVDFGKLTLETVLRGVLIFVLGAVFIRILLMMISRAVSRSKTLAPLKAQIHLTARVLLTILLVLVVLGSLGVEVTSLVALLSVAGLAVSLALQNTLSNIAGGLMLLTSRPYVLGDYVSIDGTDGTVSSIGLSHCKFTTLDNKEIQIPNSQIAAAKITNFNRLGRRRIDLTFTASYSAPTEDVYDALREAMERFPQLLQAPETHLSEYGASSISYIARMWVRPADYWTVYWGVMEAVRETFAAHGVEMTYDHLNVHMEK